MTAITNENTQHTDPDTGELLVNGFIYIGLNNLDAKLNPATIYSDRDLTTPILNPQRTGPDGRSVNKIWVAGQYSMKVESSENVQKLNDLSLGSDFITGNSTLISVSGTNLIVATASSPASSLVDNQTYIFTAVGANTLAMTLTIDAFPTYPIKKHHDVDMENGDIEANQTVAVIFNDTDKVYELSTNSAVVPLDILRTQTAAGVKTFSDGIISDVTGNLTGNLASATTAIGTLRFTKGADIASANDLVLLQDGNDNDITGTVDVNGMTDGVVNEVRQFHADGIFILKHSTAASAGFSSLYIVQGEADITTSAGDEWKGRYDGTVWRIFDYNRTDGKAIVETVQNAASDGASMVLISSQTASSSPNIDFTGLDGTYDEYLFILTSVIPAVNADLLTMLVGDSGSYRISANYQYHVTNLSNASAVYAAVASGAGTSMYVSGAIGTAAGRSYSGDISIRNPSDSSLSAHILVDGESIDGSGNPHYNGGSGTFAGTLFAIDRIRFIMSTGNIASGEFALYGIKKS